MALVERKEIVVKREDIDDRICLSISEGATFESLRKALRVNNNDGLDGRDVSDYRFYLILLETFRGEASDETRELKVHVSSELKAVIKLYDEVVSKEDE
eukprot:11836830-Ditylum_brightwellii.AAC.1